MINTSLFIFLTMFFLLSCETVNTGKRHIVMNNPRTIMLEGEEIKEDETIKFVGWRCSDFLKDGPTLVEVGFINNSESSTPVDTGFILFDGGNSGVIAFYRRKGLERVWNWGAEMLYQFNLKSDGNAYYYDFTGTEEGEKIKASQMFTCRKNR